MARIDGEAREESAHQRKVFVSGHRTLYLSASRAVFEDTPGQDPEGGCLFIAADVTKPGWSYCKAKRRPESSYCPAHHAKCRSPMAKPTGKPFRLEGPKARPPQGQRS